MLQARIGLGPWDVLNQGLERRTPLSFGAANVAVAVLVLALAWRLGARIGVATILNALLVGTFIDALLAVDPVNALGELPLGARVPLLLGGIGLVGLATALYIGADLGAGPRDSLMLVGARRTGRGVGVVRTVIEGTALACGWLLGGSVGVGTVAFALLIGPAVQLSFWLLARSPFARREEVVAAHV